jgi:hypothetical protein
MKNSNFSKQNATNKCTKFCRIVNFLLSFLKRKQVLGIPEKHQIALRPAITSLNSKLEGFYTLEGLYDFDAKKLDRFSAFPDFSLSSGVKYATENYNIDWFLGIICAYQILDNIKRYNFQIWDLNKDVNSCRIICMDEQENIVQKHHSDVEYIIFYYHHFRVYLIDKKIILPCEL